MKKVLLLIDCDSCRMLYVYSRLASEDITVWDHHGNNLIQLALRDGWAESYCRNFQYCPSCLQDNEQLASNCSW